MAVLTPAIAKITKSILSTTTDKKSMVMPAILDTTGAIFRIPSLILGSILITPVMPSAIPANTLSYSPALMLLARSLAILCSSCMAVIMGPLAILLADGMSAPSMVRFSP